MSPLLVLFLLWHFTYATMDTVIGPPGPKADAKSDHKPGEVINLDTKTKKTDEVVKNPVQTNKISDTSRNDTNATISEHKIFKTTEMESGALFRGVMVVLALSVIIIIYMALRTYYGKRNKPVMVRKYGVRTRRSDIEMTPLPLSEDEDDETLFEVGTMNR